MARFARLMVLGCALVAPAGGCGASPKPGDGPKPEDGPPLSPEQIIDDMPDELRPYAERNLGFVAREKLSRWLADKVEGRLLAVPARLTVEGIARENGHYTVRVSTATYEFRHGDPKPDTDGKPYRSACLFVFASEQRGGWQREFAFVTDAAGADQWEPFERRFGAANGRLGMRLTGSIRRAALSDFNHIELGIDRWKFWPKKE